MTSSPNWQPPVDIALNPDEYLRIAHREATQAQNDLTTLRTHIVYGAALDMGTRTLSEEQRLTYDRIMRRIEISVDLARTCAALAQAAEIR